MRKLEWADAAAYRAFRLRGLEAHPDAFTSSVEEVRAEPPAALEARLAAGAGTALWGAFVDGELAGAVGLNREQRRKSAHKATLVAMFVASEHAGRGLGSALVDAALNEARAAGIALVVLTVTDTNETARRLYQRAAFRDIGIEPDAVRVNGKAYGKRHMYLQLQPVAASPHSNPQEAP
ncbi:MAG: GNAT family N-acetyltransferase [Haliea sp.]|nr:MAG: GNAT family N-acetyltransferase [Haliea sp.]